MDWIPKFPVSSFNGEHLLGWGTVGTSDLTLPAWIVCLKKYVNSIRFTLSHSAVLRRYFSAGLYKCVQIRLLDLWQFFQCPFFMACVFMCACTRARVFGRVSVDWHDKTLKRWTGNYPTQSYSEKHSLYTHIQTRARAVKCTFSKTHIHARASMLKELNHGGYKSSLHWTA